MRPVCERSYKREAIGRAFARCDLAHNYEAYDNTIGHLRDGS
jgi:hypothetical protein